MAHMDLTEKNFDSVIGSGTKISHLTYVGDSDVDIATAKNAGVPCLSVLWGFRDRDFLTASGATHFCADPRDLPKMIKKMETEYGK